MSKSKRDRKKEQIRAALIECYGNRCVVKGFNSSTMVWQERRTKMAVSEYRNNFFDLIETSRDLHGKETQTIQRTSPGSSGMDLLVRPCGPEPYGASCDSKDPLEANITCGGMQVACSDFSEQSKDVSTRIFRVEGVIGTAKYENDARVRWESLTRLRILNISTTYFYVFNSWRTYVMHSLPVGIILSRLFCHDWISSSTSFNVFPLEA